MSESPVQGLVVVISVICSGELSLPLSQKIGLILSPLGMASCSSYVDDPSGVPGLVSLVIVAIARITAGKKTWTSRISKSWSSEFGPAERDRKKTPKPRDHIRA